MYENEGFDKNEKIDLKRFDREKFENYVARTWVENDFY